MKNINISTRTHTILAFVIVLIIIENELSLLLTYNILKKAQNLYSQELTSLESLLVIKDFTTDLEEKLLTTSEYRIDRKTVSDMLHSIENFVDSLEKTVPNQEEQKLISLLQNNILEVRNFLKEKEISGGEALKLIERLNQIENLVDRISVIETKIAKQRLEKAEKTFYVHMITVHLMLLLTIFLIIYATRKLSTYIIKPVQLLTDAVKQSAQTSFKSEIDIQLNSEFNEIKDLINKSIKQIIKYQQQLKELAYFDSLTGLPNRRYLQEYVKNLIDKKEPFAFFMIDIDNFKFINDTHGHLVGDRIISYLASELKRILRKDDFVARIGGDEFAVVIPHLKQTEDAVKIAKKLLNNTKEDARVNNLKIPISISIGIFIADKNGELDINKVFSFADIALYKAKEKKSSFEIFDTEMYTRFKSNIELDYELRKSLEENRFLIHLQPIIRLKNYQIAGFESLLRWERDGQVVYPAEFLDKLESNGLIIDVTYQIIEKVFQILHTSKLPQYMTVNLSPLLFFDKNFISYLKSLEEKYPDVLKEKIYFEITESVFIRERKHVIKVINQLKSMGYKIALDDFGTGFSSLSYLKDFPLDMIKLDRSFTKNMISNPVDLIILNSTIELSNKLNLDIVLEGIEEKRQLDFIPEKENIYLQGFLFYKPMEIEKALDLVR
ncbi:EAL domain-containing protein [Persephonella sp.]